MGKKSSKKAARKKQSQPPESIHGKSIQVPRTWQAVLIIALVIAGAYIGAVQGVLLWDDEYVIKSNLFIRDTSNVKHLVTAEYFARSGLGHYTRSGEESYRPLVTLTHILEYAVFGDSAAGYHFVNVVIHAGACAALFFLCLAMGLPRWTALAGALLFAVHPVNTETVNMVSYREDLLAGLFGITALRFVLNRRIGPALLLFGAALLSKEMALVFLPLAGVYALLHRRRDLLPVLVAMTVLTGAYLAIIFGAFPAQSAGVEYPGGTFLPGMATMSRVLVQYIGLILWPSNLAVEHLIPPSHTWFELPVIFAAILIPALIAAPRIFRFSRRAAFLWWWFFIALIPVSGLYPIKNIMAERYLYIPLMGVCILCAYGVSIVFERWRVWRMPLTVACAVVVLTFVLIDRNRTRIWHSDTAFFTEMVRASPASPKGYSSLGLAHYRAGETVLAEKYLMAALDRGDDNKIALHNLGCLSLETNRRDRAYTAFRRVLEIDAGFTESRYHMAMLLKEDGETEQAESELRQVLALRPNFIPGMFLLGVICQDSQRYGEALTLYKNILKRDPEYGKALKNIGVIYLKNLNEPANAAAYFRRYLEVEPSDPQKDLIEQVIDQADGRGV